jgi:hypothetical protein
VYARQFPSRRQPDGRPVHTYDELIDYLVAKAPHKVRVASLPFGSARKNRVVFIPPSPPPPPPMD